MKKVFFLLSFIAFGISISAQVPTIKNASFEKWTNINGYLYPDDCYFVDSVGVKAGALTQKSGGSNGSYSLHLGSYMDGGNLKGAGIEIMDSLTDRIGGLSFDFKVQNNNSFMLNGLLIHIYFFDSKQGYLGDYSWTSPSLKNYNSFVSGSFTAMFCSKDARFYLLDIGYFNYGGSTIEYAEIDNLRFSINTSIIDHKTTDNITISPYPNPASNSFSLNGMNINDVGALFLVDVNGKQYDIKVATRMDVSTLPNGIYLLKVYNRSKELIQSTKLAVLK